MPEMDVTSMLFSEMLKWKKSYVLKSKYDIITKLIVLILKNKTVQYRAVQ